jgi:hypothetical protein
MVTIVTVGMEAAGMVMGWGGVKAIGEESRSKEWGRG